MENSFKSDLQTCKQKFINCSKLEDEALEYMVNYYTSSSSVKSNIEELLYISDSASKLKTAYQSLISSQSRKRQKRQKNTESVTCTYFLTEVTEMNTVGFFLLYEVYLDFLMIIFSVNV